MVRPVVRRDRLEAYPTLREGVKQHEHSTHSTRCRLLMPGHRFDDKYLWTDNDFSRPSRTGRFHPGTPCLATIVLSFRTKPKRLELPVTNRNRLRASYLPKQ
jgi:hypothetical protein